MVLTVLRRERRAVPLHGGRARWCGMRKRRAACGRGGGPRQEIATRQAGVIQFVLPSAEAV